ncbi:disulfide bond formation protein B [Wenzhouxiangella marina]|uniref:Disulfide bond formation protein B n=1 Tax=Wenzhouxiangella marina TaxID=1579979 RepID=A0A0K0XXD9_9GAMM|nr:disulfide bond formation protein B [Wenzhouxiangella marina]AKS42345.1 Disulfide bond formation protein B [Wenzhouxiangella marina]MBB6085882.1 disulfide bond formation protein DsbB [Wenzhouxiangella marina]
MSLFKTRWPYLIVFIACVGLLAYAYYAQFVLELAPCPMCMLQRFGFMIMALMALGLAIHNPRGWGRWIYGIPFFGGAIWGMVTATQHVRLQGQPPDPFGGCGADWPTMIEFDYSWGEILTEAFTASGDCTTIDWTFLGLSMPAWTLIWYVGLALFMLPALFIKKN